MAEEKKSAKSAFGTNHFEELVFLLAGLFVLALFVNKLLEYLDSLGGGTNFLENLLNALGPFWTIWKVIVVIICAAAVIWAMYSYAKLVDVAKEEMKIYGHAAPIIAAEGLVESLELKNEKWERVKELSQSERDEDWRVAIMDADTMLDQALRAKGYVGDGVGEILKGIDKSDLRTLDAAWDAHKVRNQIAHSGSDFQLSDRETKRVIALFEAVFKELKII